MTIIQAKRHALISLQFWKDNKGVDNFTITCNENKKPWVGLNAYHFGTGMAQDPNIEEQDHNFLQSVFEYYLKERQRMTP